MQYKSLTIVLVLLASLRPSGSADAATVIFDDALRPGWTSWSWDGEFVFDYANTVLAGEYSILAAVEQYGTLSLHFDRPFPAATGVVFWLRGDGSALQFFLQTGEGAGTIDSEMILISDVATVTADDWAFVTIDFSELEVNAWDRVAIRTDNEDGTTFLIDEIVLQGVDLSIAPADDAFDMGADITDDPPDTGLDFGEDLAPDSGPDLEPEPDAAIDSGIPDVSTPDAQPDSGTDTPEDEGSTGFCQSVSRRGGEASLLLIGLGLFGWFRLRRR